MTEENQINIEEIDTSLATLRITMNGIKAEFKKKNGGKVFKNIGLGSLTKILNKNSEFDTGFMPIFGNNYIGTKRFLKTGDKEILFLEACPANRRVNYSAGSVQSIDAVRYPGLLMSVICRTDPSGKAEVKDTRLFATNGPILRERDQLYKFPFGNVWVFERGKVCWGSYSRDLENIKKVSQAAGLLNMFLDATMNTDLYRGDTNLLDFLTNLNEADSFPYEQLESDITFKELISLVKSKNVG